MLWWRANTRNVSQHTLYGIEHIHINLTLYILPPHWHRPKLVLTGTSIPLYLFLVWCQEMGLLDMFLETWYWYKESVIIPSCLLMQRDSIFCLVLCITVQGTKLITLSLEWNVSIGIYLQSITKNGFSCLQSVAELSYEGISSVNWIED